MKQDRLYRFIVSTFITFTLANTFFYIWFAIMGRQLYVGNVLVIATTAVICSLANLLLT